MADQMDIVSDPQSQQTANTDGAADYSAAAAAANIKRPSNTWDTGKSRDEVSALQSRLVDQGFNAANYGDPLTKERPLQKAYTHVFPEEKRQFFKELDEEVDRLIAKRRGQTA